MLSNFKNYFMSLARISNRKITLDSGTLLISFHEENGSYHLTFQDNLNKLENMYHIRADYWAKPLFFYNTNLVVESNFFQIIKDNSPDLFEWMIWNLYE